MHPLLVPRIPAALGWAGCSLRSYGLQAGILRCHRSPLRLMPGGLFNEQGSRQRRLALAPHLLQVPAAAPYPARGLSVERGSSAPEKENRVSSEKETTEPAQDEKKLNKSQQLKKVFKEYGAVGVSFHVGISLMSLGMFYVIVSSGVDISALLLKIGFSEAVVQSRMAAGTSTFVLAYAIHKLFAPVRISITLVSVPFIVRYFRKIGFFKNPAPK
ncbi:protein FAM210B, mitochondrial [Lissotriton helveticus]